MRKVYHGSIETIEQPLVHIGRDNLDFGKGFYVTDVLSQAKTWATTKSRYYMDAVGVINHYLFDFDKAVAEFRYKKFKRYDAEWLHFIVDCRSGKTIWKDFDLIEGGVANDSVIDTVENFIAGLIDEEKALGLLAQHRPNNQICSEKAYYEEFNKVGIKPTPRDKALLDISQMWLRRFVKSYQKATEGINFVKPVDDDYELSINFKLEDGKETYNFYGKIDKIVVSESNDHKYYSIIDYKTGAEEFNPLEVFLGKSIQLPLYYYAIEENIQPDQFTKGGEFGGFYIQHVSFSTIKGALKESNGPYLKEKWLLGQSRLGGISKDSVSYISSIDATAFKEDGSIKNNGGTLLQLKHQFKEPDSEEIIIKDDDIGLVRYNLNDLVKDAKDAAINAIHRICDADFAIAPTSYSLLKFDPNKLACNNCPYRPVCYKSKDAAVDYKKEVLKHFKKGAK